MHSGLLQQWFCHCVQVLQSMEWDRNSSDIYLKWIERHEEKCCKQTFTVQKPWFITRSTCILSCLLFYLLINTFIHPVILFCLFACLLFFSFFLWGGGVYFFILGGGGLIFRQFYEILFKEWKTRDEYSCWINFRGAFRLLQTWMMVCCHPRLLCYSNGQCKC